LRASSKDPACGDESDAGAPEGHGLTSAVAKAGPSSLHTIVLSAARMSQSMTNEDEFSVSTDGRTGPDFGARFRRKAKISFGRKTLAALSLLQIPVFQILTQADFFHMDRL